VLQLREKAVKDYEAALQHLLVWQPSTQQRLYLPAPSHLPVAVQRTWVTTPSSSSSSSEATAAAAATSMRELSPEELRVLQQIDAMVVQQLGCSLPERAHRGERGHLLASLAAAAVRERLVRWAGCCGREYVVQLVTKEPSVLSLEPEVLLRTLEALSQEMQLTAEVCAYGKAASGDRMCWMRCVSAAGVAAQRALQLCCTCAPADLALSVCMQECVAFALRHVAVVGLDGSELRARLSGLADAVGCDHTQALRVAAAQPSLLMLHPTYVQVRVWGGTVGLHGHSHAVAADVDASSCVPCCASWLLCCAAQERMSALRKLLPEAAGKMPRLVVRHPFLLTKSPRALARSILQVSLRPEDLADRLGHAKC
jgi:hypothetical protein